MKSILQQLVPLKELDSVNKLICDKECTFSMLKALGQKMMGKEDVFTTDSEGQMLLIIATAPFVKSEEECVQVTHIINWGMTETNIFPMITEHKDKDLAYRCFISLSFFHSDMERRNKYHGSPSVDFYRSVGIQTLKQIGYEDVSDDFCKWECYLSEIFV